MKYILLFLLIAELPQTYAQSEKGITFTVEKLKAPDSLIEECESRRLLHDIAPRLLVNSPTQEKLVEMGAHPFFNGMYKAYAEHRPFEISPDMIWLLICQGFSQHVNNNPEELRSMFVNFDGKKDLEVEVDKNKSLNDIATWEGIIPKFIDEAAKNTGKEFFDNLTPTFTTTTSIDRIATQITALESVKSYFEFIVIRIVCGIPTITLKGTPADWKLVLSKAKALRKYKLGWWIDEIEPQLEQFIKASEGKIDKAFWRNMFKYHTERKYGLPLVIDGWIVKFFPYNNKRQRNNLKTIRTADNLPDERVAVDFKMITVHSNGTKTKVPMQFVAGFIGLKQDHKTMSLCPQTGWFVAPKDSVETYASQLEADSKRGEEIRLRVGKFPKQLLNISYSPFLSIDFLDSIEVPECLALADIEYMYLHGKITKKEEEKIAFLFPNTFLIINDKHYNLAKPGSVLPEDIHMHSTKEFPTELLNETYIRRLDIHFYNIIDIPDELASIKIDRMKLEGKISEEEEQRIVSLFPKTALVINNHFYPGTEYQTRYEERKTRIKDWQSSQK